MANFAVAASQETIDRANKIMDMYAQSGDKKEDALLRILSIAENESVRGTHPVLEPSLRSIDGTIETLVKQINGIVSGQDAQINELKNKLDTAIEEKRSAIEVAKVQTDAARMKENAAEAAIQEAKAGVRAIREQAEVDIDTAEKAAAAKIDRANLERDQAIRERNDARTIASEKTANNDLLMRQMANMEADIKAYKELKSKYEALSTDYSTLQDRLSDSERDLAGIKKESEAKQLAMDEAFNRRIETIGIQNKLAIESAVIAKEREYQEMLRQADKENATLKARIDLMQASIS